jgi:hypothetical protein
VLIPNKQGAVWESIIVLVWDGVTDVFAGNSDRVPNYVAFFSFFLER